jgi:hypothetical protein
MKTKISDVTLGFISDICSFLFSSLVASLYLSINLIRFCKHYLQTYPRGAWLAKSLLFDNFFKAKPGCNLGGGCIYLGHSL